MESTEERILHYQRGIDRSVAILDKPRLLHCIKALSKLPVTMRHLKSTGIGRTVNSLRKIDNGVGDASKRLVTKWKDMVSNAPDSGESDEACVPDDPDNYESVNYDQENNSPKEENEDYNGVNRPEALDRPALSPPMVIDVNISPEEPETNLSDEEEKLEEVPEEKLEEEPEERSYNQSSKYSVSNKDSKDSKRESKSQSSSSNSKNSDSRDKRESSKVSKNSKDNGHEEHKRKDKDKDKERSKSRSESSSSKEKKSSSDAKKRKVESSDDESNRKKKRLSVCENETSDNDDEEPNNFVIDDIDNNRGSSSDERDKNGESSKQDRHKESSLKHSDSKSKSKDKHRSSSSSSSSKTKSSSSSSKKDDRHKSKSSSSSSSNSKETNGKDKDRHSKDEKEKDKRKSDEKDKTKDKKEHKKSKEHKEPKEKKKSKKSNYVDDSIDSMSGTSFADALGMCSMPPPKKKKESSSKKEQSSPQPSPSKSSKSSAKTEYRQATPPDEDSPDDSLSLLAPNAKLEPLSGDINEEIDLASTLPEPSPFYKPLPQVNHVQRRFDEEAMLSQVINAKVQRTKVYSGNKLGWSSVPTLQEICIRVLIENIDALEYTGGVPFDILQPILERASADQLQRLEYYNPYLVEETDQLWKFHCNKIFKTKQREEMESWREMYERCVSEREAKFKAITANIKQSRDKSLPVRSTKLAYVDHFVKPPRNVLRQQAKYGTAKVSTSASDLKKKLITGAAGPSSSSVSSGSSNVERISVPPPPPSRSRPPASNPIKKAKAPLMAKALQAIKGRYKR